MSQTSAIDEGRALLSAWTYDKPKDFLEADPNIQRVLRMYLKEAYDAHLPRLRQTGELWATTMDRLAQETNRDENLPTLRRFNGILKVLTNPAPRYHEALAQSRQASPTRRPLATGSGPDENCA